jgi:hypothetical protein
MLLLAYKKTLHVKAHGMATVEADRDTCFYRPKRNLIEGIAVKNRHDGLVCGQND